MDKENDKKLVEARQRAITLVEKRIDELKEMMMKKDTEGHSWSMKDKEELKILLDINIRFLKILNESRYSA